MPPQRKPRARRAKPKRKQNFVSRHMGTAQKALVLAKRLADAVNTEYKAADGAFSNSPDWNGSVFTIAAIAQGLNDNQRVGDSLKLQKLTLRNTMARGAADCFLRVMILRDDQNKVAAVSDVLAQSGNIYGVISPKNYDKRFQTKILYDRVFILDSSDPIKIMDVVLDLNWHIQFNNATTTVNTGDLKMLLISNQSANIPSIGTTTRITFTDN